MVMMKLFMEVYPFLEFTPAGVRTTLVQDDSTEVTKMVIYDDLFENTICSDLSDEQMTDTANALEDLAKDLRAYILSR